MLINVFCILKWITENEALLVGILNVHAEALNTLGDLIGESLMTTLGWLISPRNWKRLALELWNLAK